MQKIPLEDFMKTDLRVLLEYQTVFDNNSEKKESFPLFGRYFFQLKKSEISELAIQYGIIHK